MNLDGVAKSLFLRRFLVPYRPWWHNYPIVNLYMIVESLFLYQIDRDGKEPIVNCDGVVESFFLCRVPDRP